MPEQLSPNPEEGSSEGETPKIDFEILFQQAQDNPEAIPAKTYEQRQAELAAAIAAEDADPSNRDLHKATRKAREALKEAGDKRLHEQMHGVDASEIMGQEYVDELPASDGNAFDLMREMEAREQAAAAPTYEELREKVRLTAEARDADPSNRKLRKPAKEALDAFTKATNARAKEHLDGVEAAREQVRAAEREAAWSQATEPQLQQARAAGGPPKSGPETPPTDPDAGPNDATESETEPDDEDEKVKPLTEEEIKKEFEELDHRDAEWAAEHKLSKEDLDRAKEYVERLRYEALNSAGTSAEVTIDNPKDRQLIHALRQIYDTEGAQPTVITNQLDDTTPHQSPHDSALTHGRRWMSRIPASEGPSKFWEYRVYIVSGEESPNPETGENKGGENKVALQLRYLVPRENRKGGDGETVLSTAKLIYVKGKGGVLEKDKKTGEIGPSEAMQAYMALPITNTFSLHGEVAPTDPGVLSVGYVQPVVYGNEEHGHGHHGHEENTEDGPDVVVGGPKELESRWEPPMIEAGPSAAAETGLDADPKLAKPGEPREYSIDPGELPKGEFSEFSKLVHQVQAEDPKFGVALGEQQLLPPQVERLVAAAKTKDQLELIQMEVLDRGHKVRQNAGQDHTTGWTASEEQILVHIKNGFERIKQEELKKEREEREAAAAKEAAKEAAKLAKERAKTRKKHESHADKARKQAGLIDLDDAAAEMASRARNSEIGMQGGYVTAEGYDDDVIESRREWSAKPGELAEGEFSEFSGLVEGAMAANPKLKFMRNGTFPLAEGEALLAQADSLDKLRAFENELALRHDRRIEQAGRIAKKAGEPAPGNVWNETETKLMLASNKREREIKAAAEQAAQAAAPATPVAPEAPAAPSAPEAPVPAAAPASGGEKNPPPEAPVPDEAEDDEDNTVEAGVNRIAGRISPEYMAKIGEGELPAEAVNGLIAAAKNSEELDDVQTFVGRRAGNKELDKGTLDRIEKRRAAVETPAESLVRGAQKFDEAGKLDDELIAMLKNRAVTLGLAVRVEGSDVLIPVEGNADSEMVTDVLNGLEPAEEEEA
jgi:hypothetical protein